MSFSLKDLNNQLTYMIPLGGCSQFGMNMMLYLHNGSALVVDCGIMFPPPYILGVNGVYPQVEEILKELPKIDGYVITHGHEDHIGALSYFLELFPAPVYTSLWTKEFICSKNLILEQVVHIYSVEDFGEFKIDNFSITFIPVNHSIPGSIALFIRASNISILHCSDFKFNDDYKLKIFNGLLEFAKTRKINNIDCMLVDSTNADLQGYCTLESDIKDQLKTIIQNAPQAVFITLFSSNAFRIKLIYEICKELRKKICVFGQSIEYTLNTAVKLGLIPSNNIFVSIDNIPFFQRNEMVFLVAGCQAEITSSLKRIALNQHEDIKICPGDVIIFSSRTIPGNEYYVQNLIIECKKNGAQIYTQENFEGIHASGHAYEEDIKQLIHVFKPKFYIPIHGTYDKLYANACIAKASGISEKQVLLISNGDVVELDKNNVRVVNKLDIQKGYFDYPLNIPLTHKEIKDRLNIATNGLLIIYGAFDVNQNKWIQEPSVEVIGLGISRCHGADDFNTLFIKEIKTYYEGNCILNLENIDALKIKLRKIAQNIFGKKPIVMIKIILIK